MIAKEINITHTGQILASFIIGLCLCLWTALNMKPAIGVAIGFIPFATLFIFICINKPAILLAITFMLNYLIMGIKCSFPRGAILETSAPRPALPRR